MADNKKELKKQSLNLSPKPQTFVGSQHLIFVVRTLRTLGSFVARDVSAVLGSQPPGLLQPYKTSEAVHLMPEASQLLPICCREAISAAFGHDLGEATTWILGRRLFESNV